MLLKLEEGGALADEPYPEVEEFDENNANNMTHGQASYTNQNNRTQHYHSQRYNQQGKGAQNRNSNDKVYRL